MLVADVVLSLKAACIFSGENSRSTGWFKAGWSWQQCCFLWPCCRTLGSAVLLVSYLACLMASLPYSPFSESLLSTHCVSTPQFSPNTRDKGLISQKLRFWLVLYAVCQRGRHTARPLSPDSRTRACPDYPWHLGSWGLDTGDINCSNIEKQWKGFLFKTARCHTCR